MLTSTWQPLAASLAGFGTGKSLALELPTPATCILAMFHCQPQRAPFSVRRLWSKIGISASPAASLLRGPTVFERFRCRPRSSWATPRQPVRCSRPDTSCSLARADGVLLERAAGPLSRCTSTLAMVAAAIDTYSSGYAWLSASMWPLVVAVRSGRAARAICLCARWSERDDTSGSTSRVHSRVCL